MSPLQDINVCIMENYPECSNPRLFTLFHTFVDNTLSAGNYDPHLGISVECFIINLYVHVYGYM